MKKVLILGSGGREKVLAEKLILENNIVYMMTDKINFNINENIILYNYFFNKQIIESINPDILFAFSDDYIFDLNINNKIHELCIDGILAVPKAKFIPLEKDKLYVSKLIGNNELQYVESLDKMTFLKKGKRNETFFVRETGNKVNKCFVLETRQYINKIKGDSKGYFVEPYFEGENITITCYIYNGKIVIFPYVNDFPFVKWINGNYLIKTGGIKCVYNMGGKYGINRINYIIPEIICKIRRLVGDEYIGFLSVQILINKEHYHLVEFDIRPGEPEFINVINAINEDITSVFFEPYDEYCIKGYNKYSISLAIASEEYPYNNTICIDPMIIEKKDNIKIYWSKGVIDGKYIRNYEGGRLAFIFFEGNNDEEVRVLTEDYRKKVDRDFVENKILLFI